MRQSPANSLARRSPPALPPARRLRPARRSGLVLCAVLAALATAACSTRHDPTFNPYGPAPGERGALGTADAILEHAHDALDNLDRRLENALY